MREAFGSIREHFVNGLCPDERATNAPYLYKCHDIKASETGLRTHETITSPGTPPEAGAWGAAQYIPGQLKDKWFFQSAIYEADSGTLLDEVDAWLGSALPITPGGLWHYAEENGVWFAANGANLVCYMPWVTGARVFASLACNTVCVAGHSVVLGGLSGARLSSNPIQRAWTAWKKFAGVATTDSLALDSSWVMWWSIGGGLADRPWLPEIAMLSAFDADYEEFEPQVHALIEAGRLGFAYCGKGAVKQVLPLGSNAVVYGENSVGVLDSVYGDDGVVRFRYKKLLDIGVKGRTNACGDDKAHYFVDSSGELWALSGEGPVRMGYRQYLSPVLADAAEFVASFDPYEREAYFASGQNVPCYVLRQGKALSSRTHRPTGLFRRGGTLYGVTFRCAEETSPNRFDVISMGFDMNQRELKTLDVIQASARNASELKASIQFRYQGETSWRNTQEVVPDRDNATYPHVAGQEFRVRFTGLVSSGVEIDYGYYRWKLSGRRTLRGIYAQS